MEKKVQSLYTPGWINRRLKKNWLGKGKKSGSSFAKSGGSKSGGMSFGKSKFGGASKGKGNKKR